MRPVHDEIRPAPAQPDLLRAAVDPLDPTTWEPGSDVGAPATQPELRAVEGGPKRVAKGTSPTQRSLKRLREMGYTVQVVEKWNPHAKIRQDLFGFIDVLAIRKGEVLAVQACAGGDASRRVQKIADHENVGIVRQAGIRIEVHAWRKLASGRYECRVVDCS
jgi:hypothetical protein